MMFGLVVAKFQFPCRSPYLQLSVLKSIFGRLPGWREEWPLWDVFFLPPVILGAWSHHPAFAAVPGGLQQPQALAFGRWTPDYVNSWMGMMGFNLQPSRKLHGV